MARWPAPLAPLAPRRHALARSGAAANKPWVPDAFPPCPCSSQTEAALGHKHGGMLVVYTTSVGTVMSTKIRCTQLKQIFIRLRVHFEERNIYMSKDYMAEIKERLPGGLRARAELGERAGASGTHGRVWYARPRRVHAAAGRRPARAGCPAS